MSRIYSSRAPLLKKSQHPSSQVIHTSDDSLIIQPDAELRLEGNKIFTDSRGVRFLPVRSGFKTEPEDVPYFQGAEGMIRWTEDLIYVSLVMPGEYVESWIPIRDLPTTPDPKTGKCYSDIWEHQKNVLREALAMDDNGEFLHRLIVFCWMRGEGKSFLACLIQLWKFFCFKYQKIMLGANSKDQVKFVHYDIMREIIVHSPGLYKFIGARNIQEKEIRLCNKRNGAVESMVRSISSFSGIVSNITGYTFSEMFDMKNPKFFVQLDGSIRNMTNAFGVIDSTVSEKTHVLYQLYENSRLGKTKSVFFHYRCSKKVIQEDYWNPKMDNDQLNDYRVKFPFGEFERYFMNTWDAGTIKIFTNEIIEEMGCIGCDGAILNHAMVQTLLKEKYELIALAKDSDKKHLADIGTSYLNRVQAIDSRLKRVQSIYTFGSAFENNEMATAYDLERLTELFDTNWVILGGADIGDPLAVNGLARTAFTLVAKGLPGSRLNPLVGLNDPAPKFIYILLYMAIIPDHSLDIMKTYADQANTEFNGLDVMCTERYGSWDMVKWCEEHGITHESAFPNYDRQKDAFTEFFTASSEGRFKAPPVNIIGSKSAFLFKEELEMFNHDLEKKKFGSPEKFKKGGIQDDGIYSVAWSIYGGRNLGVDDFRLRLGNVNFGEFYANEDLIAKY